MKGIGRAILPGLLLILLFAAIAVAEPFKSIAVIEHPEGTPESLGVYQEEMGRMADLLEEARQGCAGPIAELALEASVRSDLARVRLLRARAVDTLYNCFREK